MQAAEAKDYPDAEYSNSLTDFQSAETLKGKELKAKKNFEQYLRTPEESGSTAL